MTFTDLPPGWQHQSLSDPSIAVDVIDLVVTHADRCHGGVALLVVDDGGRLVQPVLVGVEHPVPAAEHVEVVLRLAQLVRACEAEVGAVLALVRPSGAVVTDDDRAWQECAVQAFRKQGVPLLGTYLVTEHVVRPFPVLVAPSPLG